jgi:hypothetical protein
VENPNATQGCRSPVKTFNGNNYLGSLKYRNSPGGGGGGGYDSKNLKILNARFCSDSTGTGTHTGPYGWSNTLNTIAVFLHNMKPIREC